MRISAALGLIAAAFLPSATNAFGGGKGTSSSPTEPLVARSSRRDFLATGATVGAGVVTSGVITSPPFGSGEAIATAAPSSAALRGAISLPPIGLGAWAWGDSIFWGYDKKNDGDLAEVFDYAVSKDLAFFDTAELYGFGRSEQLLGDFRAKYPPEQADKVQIASKFAAFPFRTKPQDVVNACRKSVERLGNKPIDLYQIHFPNAWSNAEYWDGLAMAYEEGLVKAVGVSNYGVDAVRACHSALAERNIKLASNQIQYSLLYRYPQENGLLDACRELDVKVLSYSPLALGFLTGKYSSENLPSGPRKKLGEKLFESGNLSSLLEAMAIVSANHNGAPLSQVAVNWCRAKGTIPIPGARSLKQAKQNLESLDWNISNEEMALLDAASAKVPAYIDSSASPFPKKDTNTGLVMFDS